MKVAKQTKPLIEKLPRHVVERMFLSENSGIAKPEQLEKMHKNTRSGISRNLQRMGGSADEVTDPDQVERPIGLHTDPEPFELRF